MSMRINDSRGVPGQSNLNGIILMLTAMAALSAMDAGVKWLVLREVPVLQIIAMRGWLIIGFLLILVFFKYDPLILRTAKLKQHLLRAALGMVAPVAFFISLRFLPLADATAIFFCGIFFMTVGSSWFLDEPVGTHRWVAAITGFTGVLLVVQPGTAVFQAASILPILAALAYAMLMLWGRKLSKTESTFNLVFYFNLVFCLLGTAGLPFVWHDIGIEEILVLLLVAVLALSGYFFMTRAFTVASIAVIAPFEYTALVWALILGYAVWGELPNMNSWIGIAIIVSSGLYIMYRERSRAD